MFKGFNGNFWRDEIWTGKIPAAELDFRKRLKVFDYCGIGSMQATCLEVTEDNVLSPALWLYTQGMKPLRLQFDLNEYADKLLQTKGIWGWQFFYTDISLRDENHVAIKENCELIVEWYDKIFPGDFIEELKKKYQKLVKL
jgi:hypothetical protein